MGVKVAMYKNIFIFISKIFSVTLLWGEGAVYIFSFFIIVCTLVSRYLSMEALNAV